MKIFLKYNKNNAAGSICLEKWLQIFKDDEIIIMTDLWPEDQVPEFTAQYPQVRLRDFPCKNRNLSYHEKFKDCVSPTHSLFDSEKGHWLEIPSSKWENALVANLTCLEIAKKDGDEYCWIIDADDIVYMAHDFAKLREKLRQVETETIRRGLDGCSQDMYRRWCDHWTFGVLFIRSDIDLEPLLHITPEDYGIVYGIPKSSIDVVFDILRRKCIYKLESFVIQNIGFAHADANYPTFNVWSGGKNWWGEAIKLGTIVLDY